MAQQFLVGDRVRVVSLPPFIKTADSMPMLRPPTVIAIGEEGIVVEHRLSYWSVRFISGTYLIDGQHLESVPTA